MSEKRERYAFSPEQFVTAWTSSSSVGEVCEKLSCIAGKSVPKSVVVSRASLYRKSGVNLKKMPRQNNVKLVDIDALNNLVASSS